MDLNKSKRTIHTDKVIDGNLEGTTLEHILFERLVSVNTTFEDVNFSYCIFEGAYLRNCNFKSCNFTGCKFVNSSLVGSKFVGCTFNYARFDKTIVENSILDNCPSYENVKSSFARSLRVNYQSLGDSNSVNKAIKIEIQSSIEHYYKAWYSQDSYCRKKYTGFSRFLMFCKWFEYFLLDIIWGNGESTWKLLRFVLIVLFLISIYHFFITDIIKENFLTSMIISPQILFGLTVPEEFNKTILMLVTVIRLILFGFFMSIIIKRFNRR